MPEELTTRCRCVFEQHCGGHCGVDPAKQVPVFTGRRHAGSPDPRDRHPLGGFSTIWLARCARPEGRVVTLEYEPTHAQVARANVERAGVEDRVEVVVGAALETLPTLRGPCDLVFIDADKENNVAYLEWAIRLHLKAQLPW